VKAQPNGNFEGEGKFKLFFKHGGAIELGQAMLAAVTMGKIYILSSYFFTYFICKQCASPSVLAQHHV